MSLTPPAGPRRLPARARAGLAAALGVIALSAGTAAAPAGAARAAASARPQISVLASGLDEPKKLTLTASGDLIVALSGDGAAPSSCTDGNETSCLDRSGAIDEVTPSGAVRTLRSGLASVSSGASDPQATGPVQARLAGGRLEVLFQDLDLDATTGVSSFGAATDLGDLAAFSGPGAPAATVRADLGRYEARHEPDHGAGTAVRYGWEAAVNSDPYAFVPYRGGYAIADAGANDVLFLSRRGRLSVLAVLPTIRERAAARTFGTKQGHAIEAAAQAVPTGLAVGPDGALYVGELGGAPFARGSSSIYRIVPGHAATVYATGFTAIGDLAFDHQGRLLVLELDRRGLNDPGIDKGDPASGAIIAIDRSGVRQTLVSSGLDFPTGLAVGRGDVVYVSDRGISPADSGRGGEILRVVL